MPTNITGLLPIIIGITGTLGAGKGTIVEHLGKKGFKHYSVRAYITEEIERRGLPVNRDHMVAVGNDLRAKNSPSYIVEQLYERAQKAGGNCVIESIRTPGEAEALKKKGVFYLFAVDAKPETRYQRIIARKSATDNVSFKEFLQNEKREMHSTDPNRQNLGKCIEMSDFQITNNGTFQELYQSVDKILEKIKI
ncbi:AAA family ATPase [Candidatus Uhrbacteria bacterium]|nr:AAA family ATPase [Candidatus Uhrbacteria bacterium]